MFHRDKYATKVWQKFQAAEESALEGREERS